MATYTDNYTMTKPTYAEQADISVINANMDIIDNVMHSSQISLAPAYDINETYNTGDIVMYELLMYKCLEDNVTGAWDSTKWTRTTAGEESGGGADLDIYGEASGTAEASFSDGAEASLVECIVEIEATQSGSGTPSPSNVRPIVGRSAVNITVSDGETDNITTIPLGRTVYGGTLDVTRGILTVTHELVTAPARGSADSSGKLYTLAFSPSIGIKSWGQTEAPSTYIKSNMFEVEGLSEARASEDKCLVQYGTAIYAGGYIGEESALDTLLATLQIKYELATPQTYTLTPEEVSTILGYNNISADSGDVSVVYVKQIAPIKPNPTGADIPLKGIEIDGEKFSIPQKGRYTETTLWEGSGYTESTWTLSDDFRNYDALCIFMRGGTGDVYTAVNIIPTSILTYLMNNPTYKIYNGTDGWYQYFRVSSPLLFTREDTSTIYVNKIIGIKYNG